MKKQKKQVSARKRKTIKKPPFKKYRVKLTSVTTLEIKHRAVENWYQIFTTPILFKLKQKKRTKRNLVITLNSSNWLSYLLIGVGLFGIVFYTGRSSVRPLVVESSSVEFRETAIPGNVSPTNQTASISLPAQLKRLKIPNIAVDSSFEIVKQKIDGTLGTPDVFSGRVGWYDKSPLPGQMGPSVVVGHVDSYVGPSVFWNLHKLKAGDDIIVETSDGKSVTFVTSSVEQFDQTAFPTEKVYGNIDHAGLRLITCGGVFDKDLSRYTKNTVVFARLKI